MKKLNKNMKKNRNKVLFFQSPCIFKVYFIRLRGHRLVEFGIRREIILERNDLSTCSAYQVMMMMSFFSIEEFSDLITCTSIIKIDTIHQLHFQ